LLPAACRFPWFLVVCRAGLVKKPPASLLNGLLFSYAFNRMTSSQSAGDAGVAHDLATELHQLVGGLDAAASSSSAVLMPFL
jgi:hypothetical protein